MSEGIQIAVDSVPRLPRGVKFRFDKTREKWVVLAPERVFVPDDIAVEVLKRCDGEATVDAIVEDLAATFNAPRDVIAKDVLAMLQDLANKGVMTA